MQRLTVKKRYSKDGKYGDHTFDGGQSHEVTDVHVMRMMNEWLNEHLKNRHVLDSEQGREQFLKNIDIDVQEDDPEHPDRSKKDRFNGVVNQLSVDNKPDPYRDITPDYPMDAASLADKHRESLAHASTILGYDVLEQGFERQADFRGQINQVLLKALEVEEIEGVEGGLKERLEGTAQAIEQGTLKLDDKDRTQFMAAKIVGVGESAPYPEWEKAVFDQMSPLRERDHEELLALAGQQLKDRHGFTEQELEEFSREVENGNAMHENRQQPREAQRQQEAAPSAPAQETPQPTPLHGADINLKRPEAAPAPEAEPAPEEVSPEAQANQPSDASVEAEADASQAPDSTAPADADPAMTEKRARKMLGLSTDDVMGNLRKLSENRQREVFMHHLLNTDAGKAALDNHVKERGQGLKDKGVAGKEIYNQVTAKLMAATLEEMQQTFSDVAQTILNERNALNVDEEFAAMREIEPSIARLDADEKNLKQELREIKQHDNYFLSDSDPKMLQRIISSKLSYAEMQKKPFPYGKALKGSMFALGGMAAIASGGAPAAALFLATKGAMSMANRMIDKSEQMKASAGDALVKGGVVSQQDIDKSDQEMEVKAKGGKWKRALAIGAVAVASFAVGDAMDGTSKLVDLWEVGKELVSSTPELDDHAYSRTLDALNLVPEGSVLDPEAVGAAVNLAESAADPAAAAAQQAGELVTEGSPLNAESVETGVEAVTQARDAAPELEAVSEAAEQAPVEPVLHEIKPGDTASQIAYDYLKEKGITVTAADLYGSNGILAQTGLNQDLILAGGTLDLTSLDQLAQNMLAENNLAPEALAEAPSSESPVAPSAPQDEAVSRFTANLEATRAQGALAHTSETYTQLFGRGIDLPSVSTVGSAPAEALAATQGEASPVMDEILSVRDDLSAGDLNRSSPLLQEGAVHDLMDNAVGEVMGNGLEDVESGPQVDGQTPEADEELAEQRERDDTPGMG